MLNAVQLISKVWIFGAEVLELLHPSFAEFVPALANSFAEVLANAIRDEELCIFRPAIGPLGQSNLTFSQRLTMGGARVLFTWGAIGDVSIHDDQCRAVGSVQKSLIGTSQHFEIIRVADPRYVPAIAHEARGDVFTECEIRVSFDGDVIVIINPAEVSQFQVPGQRCGFARHPFHHVAISAHGINAEVEHLELWPIEMRFHPAFRNGHAYTVGHTLSERSGGGFNPRRQPVFRMSGRLAPELAETLDILQRDRKLSETLILRINCPDTRQVQQRV